jgi:deoxyribonuclease V
VLRVDREVVGYRLRSRSDVKSICVDAGWRTSADLARDVALSLCLESRTPEPLRQARRLARASRPPRGGLLTYPA